MDQIILIGLGNILLTDDGVGVHVINRLKERYDFTPRLSLIDGGTLGLDLLPLLQDKTMILLVDAVDFGKEPGHIEEMEDDQIPLTLGAKLSVHHIGLPDLLAVAKWTDVKPKKICLIGIQPKSLNIGLEMTPLIQGKLKELVERVIAKLEAWGTQVCRRLSETCQAAPL